MSTDELDGDVSACLGELEVLFVDSSSTVLVLGSGDEMSDESRLQKGRSRRDASG